ncbi:MAG: hypothetical protein ACRDQ0_08165 [Pseudonocardia sp.]
MTRSTAPVNVVYSVHTTRPDEAGAVEIVFTSEPEARAYARDRSTDWRVTSASVTRFTVGELGTRWPIGWYVDGVEQSPRWNRQLYPT